MIASALRWLFAPLLVDSRPTEDRRAWDLVDIGLLPDGFRAAVARYEAANAVSTKPDCACTPGTVCTANRACPRLAEG